MNAYDRYLQGESLDWLEGMDEETTEGYLQDLTGEPLDEEDEELETFRNTGIY